MKLCPGFSGHLHLLLGLALAGSAALRAADPVPGSYPQLNPQQLEQLLGPIALYPDPLIALILPASTEPADVVLAARYLNSGGDPTQLDAQPWNESIRALSRYPAVVKWMDENLQWTRELGGAFLTQPDAVMNSVQRLRASARASGALVSTPEQQVVVEDDIIQIVPAQPNVIYVPYYDPAVVYVMPQPGYYYPYGPYLTFGVGFPVGIWLSYGFDWHDHVIVVGDRHHNWQEHQNWYHQSEPGSQHGDRHNDSWHPWKAPAGHAAPSRPDPYRPPPEISRPKPFPGAPPFSPKPHSPENGHSQPNPIGRDSDRNHSPVPAAGNPPVKHDNHGQPPAMQPPAPKPVTGPATTAAPRPSGQPHTPGPVPTSGPTVSHESHDRGPATPPPAPRPETVSMPPNPPRSSAPPGAPSSPVMSNRASAPPLPPPSAMGRSQPAMPASRPMPSPPPPATNSKDSGRDTKPEEAR